MAKQESFIKLTGKLGDVVFYKNKDGYFAKTKGGASRERILKEEGFACTRENIAEFSSASTVVGQLKSAIRPTILRCTADRLHGRLSNLLNRILKSDPESDRGKRTLAKGDWSQAKGFELNPKAKFSNAVKTVYRLEKSENTWTVRFADLKVDRDIQLPQAATHVRFYLLACKFGNPDNPVSPPFRHRESEPIPIESGSRELLLETTLPDGDHEFFAVVLGLEFLILSGPMEFEVGRKKFNAAQVVEAGVVLP
jgi:hypothetical protein